MESQRVAAMKRVKLGGPDGLEVSQCGMGVMTVEIDLAGRLAHRFHPKTCRKKFPSAL